MPRNDGLYSRQQNLKLKKYQYAIVVGCGGIGNWVAMDLALTGCVENLYIIDPDIVEESNLNRTMFEYNDIGSLKVEATARIIGRRRPVQNIFCINELMDKDLAIKLRSIMMRDNSYYHSDCVIIDCRDDIFDDCYDFNCKLYKVGYDGMAMTINGNPRLTKVFGQRGGSYTVTPSYVGSAQLIAILVVNDILYPQLYRLGMQENNFDTIERVESGSESSPDFNYITSRPCGGYDELGRLNDCYSFDCSDILKHFMDPSDKYVIPDDNFSNLPGDKK